MTGFILSSFLALLFFTFQPTNSATDHCLTPSCSHAEFLTIHFPFRLPRFNNKTTCSYDQNFILSCSPQEETLLHLPNSGSFAIEAISYHEQTIFISDTCFPQRVFDGFDLSNSAFTTFDAHHSYTFYNCTSLDPYYYNKYFVSCMSGADRGIILMIPGGTQKVSNCSVLRTVSSAPELSYGYWYEHKTYVQLYWYDPYCGSCLSNGGICGFKGHSQSVGCRSAKGQGLSEGAKIGIIVGVSVPALFIILLMIRNCGSSRSEAGQVQQPPVVETQLVQSQRGAVQLGLDRPTIESYPMYKLGQNDALLEPSTGPRSICLCEYKPDDALRTIPDCNHYFHSDCVDEWLGLHATCPVCRKVPDVT